MTGDEGWGGPADAAEPMGSFMADINVTPLVDVILVLLFIFMVTAPLMTMAFGVDLPEATTSEPAPPQVVVISLGAEGSVAVDDRVMSMQAAVAAVKQRVADAGGGAGVYLRADASLPYGYVLSVLDGLRKSGVLGVELVTQPLADEVMTEADGEAAGP